MEIKQVIRRLDDAIDIAKYHKNPPNQMSWIREVGVLISLEEAEIIYKELTNRGNGQVEPPAMLPKGWSIDLSTGTPMLMFEKCSVIQDEQACLILELLTTNRKGTTMDIKTDIKSAEEIAKVYSSFPKMLELEQKDINNEINELSKSLSATRYKDIQRPNGIYITLDDIRNRAVVLSVVENFMGRQSNFQAPPSGAMASETPRNHQVENEENFRHLQLQINHLTDRINAISI